MATAETKKREVIAGVVLSLSLAEARVLQTLIGARVVGDPQTSGRKLTNAIWYALNNAGVVSVDGVFVSSTYISFAPDTLEKFGA